MRKVTIRKKTQPKHGGRIGQLPPLSSTAPINDLEALRQKDHSAVDGAGKEIRASTLEIDEGENTHRTGGGVDVSRSLEIHSTRELLENK